MNSSTTTTSTSSSIDDKSINHLQSDKEKEKEAYSETNSQCLSFNDFIYWSTPLSHEINIDEDDDDDNDNDELVKNKSRFNLDNFYYAEKNKIFNAQQQQQQQATSQTLPANTFDTCNKISQINTETSLKSSNFNAQINFSSLITTTRFLNLNHSPLTRNDSTLSIDSLSPNSINNPNYKSNNESKLSLNSENNVDTFYANKRNSLLLVDASVTSKQTSSKDKRNSIQIDILKEESIKNFSSSNTKQTPETSQPSSLGVVSRLKNWINKPARIFQTPQQISTTTIENDTDSAVSSLAEQTDSQSMYSLDKKSSFSKLNTQSNEQTKSIASSSMNSTSFSCIGGEGHDNNQNHISFNPPLSIDFICKLKRPTQMPNALEYNRSQTFQGALLEDWLMQSLDDHLANQHQFFTNNKHTFLPSSIDASTNTDFIEGKSKNLLSTSVTSLPPETQNNTCGISAQSTATNSTTSLVVVDTLSYNYIPNASSSNDFETNSMNEQQTNTLYKNLNSDSYKIAIENTTETNDLLDLIESNNTKNTKIGSSNANELSSKSFSNPLTTLAYKRQEANFYVQQILTNLLALGVLEFESGFENAINKTFKPKSDYVWSKYFPVTEIQSPQSHQANSITKIQIWPPSIHEQENLSKSDLTKSSLETDGTIYSRTYTNDCDHLTSISSLKKEHRDYVDELKKQHENEIYDLKSEYSIKVISLEDKIDKLNKEIETSKKLIASLSKEITELKIVKSTAQNETNSINSHSLVPAFPNLGIPPPPPPLASFFSAIPPPPPPMISNSSLPSISSIPPPPPPMSSLSQSSIPSPSPPMMSGIPPPPPPMMSGIPPPPPPTMSGIPPPPPPMMSGIPPPPPPMMSGGPPPPPPPMMPGGPPPPPPMMPGGGPPPPPPPMMSGGPPPPPPMIGAIPNQMYVPQPPVPLTRPITRKKYVTKEEMKVLYWNRIQIFNKSEAIWFEVEEPDIEDDFVTLFSKQASSSKTLAKKPSKQTNSPSKQECVKLLDSKRSQAIGILMTSQRLDFQLIREALMDFDNQILNFETLNSIYTIRPQEDEIRCIQDYLKNATSTSAEENLDKPELFLLELSRIPAFEERIFCLVYNNKFVESISSIEFRINNINTVCEELGASEKVRKILGIILGCGNNMNAANKTRGDADGFDLAILPNLKDVKSKDNSTNLIQYIASFYVNKYDDDLVKFPLPDPSDFNFVAQINFDELEKEIRKVKSEISEVEKRIENVLKISNNNTNSETDESLFKKRVNTFLTKAKDECKEQEENFVKCKSKFHTVVKLFCVKPKSGDGDVTPEYFFSLWSAFCLDFKNSWKRETQKLAKQRLKALNEKRNEIKRNSVVQPIGNGEKKSLKALFQQKRNEESKNK